jgi:ubiquinone/menaquinone biosynthesis C-methylase UbiE
MDENTLKHIAQQLRKPEGEGGKQVGQKMNSGNKYINQWTIEQLNVSTNDNILEIGMGNGFFVKDILSVDNSVRYTGCDFSQLMVEEASEMNKQFIEKGRAQLFLSTADKLPFKDETFNKVFTVNTIYFWEDPKKVLSEFRRVLKPEGKLIISLRPESEMKNYPFVKHGFTLYGKNDVQELLSKNSFTVTNTIEKKEPDQEINGHKVKVETLIVCAEKKL